MGLLNCNLVGDTTKNRRYPSLKPVGNLVRIFIGYACKGTACFYSKSHEICCALAYPMKNILFPSSFSRKRKGNLIVRPN